jgi:carboxymethylenebutenolidase
MPIVEEPLKIKCKDGMELPAFLSRPADSQPHPALLVIHEAWGLTDQIRGVARRYSEEGFVALAPHLLGRAGELLSEENIESAMKLMWSVPPEKRNDPSAVQAILERATESQRQVINLFFLGRERMEQAMAEDLLSCVERLQASPYVDAQRLGVTGFCMGGGLTYQVATLHPFKAAVPFYGANPKPIEAVANISGAVLGIYAAADDRINAGVPALVEAMVKHKKDFGLRMYRGTQHAFFNEQRPTYDADAAKDAWHLALGFFRRYLQ